VKRGRIPPLPALWQDSHRAFDDGGRINKEALNDQGHLHRSSLEWPPDGDNATLRLHALGPLVQRCNVAFSVDADLRRLLPCLGLQEEHSQAGWEHRN
jgi:hypothetical protein